MERNHRIFENGDSQLRLSPSVYIREVSIINTPITFTPGQLIALFLGVCAVISAAGGAVAWIAKGVSKARAPEKRQDERITELERRVAKHDEFLDRDKERLEAIEEGNRVTQRAILALLAHGIDGNDIDALRAAKTELQDYLIKR